METKYIGCVFNKPTEGNRRGELSGKVYYYEVIDGIEAEVGDVVVCVCATGWQVVDVVEINCVLSDAQEARVTARVVAKVDMDAYNAYCEKEERKKKLARQLAKKKKELEGMLAYELLAEKDPAFKAILDEFKALGGTVGTAE